MYTNIAHWYVHSENRAEALEALSGLADQVLKSEPDTWGYLIHTGADGSLPPVSSDEIIFIEIYKNQSAFLQHIKGPAYTGFIKQYGSLFIQVPPSPVESNVTSTGQPFFLAEHIERHAGFIRQQACG